MNGKGESPLILNGKEESPLFLNGKGESPLILNGRAKPEIASVLLGEGPAATQTEEPPT